MTTDCIAAYTAGIVDGEGSIHIGRRPTSSAAGYTLQPVIEVTTCDDKITAFMHKHWGGGLLVRKRQPPCRDANMWHLTGFGHIVAFLESIRPYLQFKGPQADVAIEFCKSRSVNYLKSRDKRGITEHELALHERLKSLHL